MNEDVRMQDLVPLLKTQRNLARHQKYHPGDTAFNLTFLTKISGPLDVDRLERVLRAVSSETEAFKVDFPEIGGTSFQRSDETRQPAVALFRRPESVTEDEFVRGIYAYAWKLQNTAPKKQWPLHDISLHVASPGGHAYIVTSVPHLIADGYGYSAWLNQVSARYNAGGQTGQHGSSPELPPQRTKASAKPDDDSRSLAFYTQEIGHLGSLEMPSIAQIRNDAGGICGRTLVFELSREPIDATLGERKISAGQFFFAAYACLLKRLVPDDPIVVGYAVPGRNAENMHDIGCFINTVPAVLDIDATMSFNDVVGIIGKKLFRLHRYQNYDPDMFPSVSPRMTSLFTFYAEEFNYALDGCSCVSIPVERMHLPAEIRLTVEARAACYRPVFDLGAYFDEIDLTAEFRQLLQGVIEHPEQPISMLPLSQSVAYGAAQEISDRSTVPQAFAAVVSTHPQRPALQQGDHSISYAELDDLSNRLAAQLRPQAASRGTVALSADGSIEAVATILAILKLGKVYVPLDPKLPSARVRQILDDLDAPFLVSKSPLGESCPGISLDALIEAALGASQSASVHAGFDIDAIAYIIYTSGSTGVPKGIPISHRNLLSMMHACQQQFRFSCEDVWTLFHSLSFDYSIWEIFGCLLHGGKLVIPHSEAKQDPEQLYALLHQKRVTVLCHTPSVFKNLIREDVRHGDDAMLRPRYVFLGGEALHFFALQDWTRNHPLDQCRVVNLYGPTEATVLATNHVLHEQDLATNRSLIGAPIAGSAIHVRTRDGAVAVRGVPGEIVITGPGVARGYYKRDDATRQKFSGHGTSSAFRTGDLGRMSADGILEYQGRLDRQVKVRGFRLELAEIEAALGKVGMADSAVDLVEFDGAEDCRLVAYVVPGSEPFDEQNVRTGLRGLLPAYMSPAIFVQTSRIPVTMSGKVDFAELAKQVRIVSRDQKGDTTTEKWLAGLVAATLKHDHFDVTDNLFDIGLSSLDIVALVSDILGKHPTLPLKVLDVFEYPSVRALGYFLDHSLRPAGDSTPDAGRAHVRQAMLAAQRTVARVED